MVNEKRVSEIASGNGTKGVSSRDLGGLGGTGENSRATGASQNGGLGQSSRFSAGMWALIIVLMSCAAVLADCSVVCLV